MGPESISSEDATATPVVKLANLIIHDAIAQPASDIHVEPGRRVGVIRYRVDGVLRKHMDLPMAAMNRVISRIKILAELDIADRLRPQDDLTAVTSLSTTVSGFAVSGCITCGRQNEDQEKGTLG